MCSQTDDPSQNDWERGMFTPQAGDGPIATAPLRGPVTTALAEAADTGPVALIAAVLKMRGVERPDSSQIEIARQIADLLEYFDYAIVPLASRLTARELAASHDTAVRAMEPRR